MNLDRSSLKAAAVALLDSLAAEHPIGHQDSKARRYLLQVAGGTPLELMFEQDEKSSANLWVHAGLQPWTGPGGTNAPSAALWTKSAKGGGKLYGRHSGLKAMPQLGPADLIRYPVSSLAQLGALIDGVWAASASRVSI